MLRTVCRVGGLTTITVGSFLLGRSFEGESDVFKKAHAATALTPAPMPQIPVTVPDYASTSKELAPSRASQIMKYGFPGFDNLRTYEDFVLSYDRKTRTAHWVCEHLTPDRPDESVHKYFQSRNEDYKGSGFDRGHLAAAGNHRRSQSSVDQTFLLTNMSPQVGKGFNRDKWNCLEKYCRGRAKKALNTYILTGPLYLPRKELDGSLYVKYQVIGANHVAVPTHFFKVLLLEIAPGNFEIEYYMLPNQPIDDSVELTSFLCVPELIERSAGFLIFADLPKNQVKKINRKGTGFW
ncbi:unnamed protein product [Caenorhabditis auriculariae]|uniref:Endonuclease n=1 Tax=Caenorhabditis auriculariae TaxID=2777116 RepID=A0A8S1H1S2_9PELO|nr:unnamed protein product [Caenorhabditis auriculariae]